MNTNVKETIAIMIEGAYKHGAVSYEEYAKIMKDCGYKPKPNIQKDPVIKVVGNTTSKRICHVGC